MKHFYRGCAGVVLMLVLSVPAFAGQIPCGGITDPPPQTTEATTEADGQMTTGVVEAAITLLQSVLSML
ncbi:MAG TPA: hypothetical protein VF658_09215 [Pyrinomonadaceae bacterium]|jgi:hypothetical protein